MLKKFLACFTLVLFFCCVIFSVTEAKSKAEFKNLTVNRVDDETFKISAEFKGDLKENEIQIRKGGQFLLLDIENSSPGRISKVSGVTNNAKDFVEKVFVGEVKKNQTRISFSFAEQIDEETVNISIAKEKKSSQLIVEVKKFVDKKSAAGQNFDVSDKVVVIDPGHGGGDSGAVGHYGVKEKDVTLYVGLRVEKLLKDAGAKVVMTRTTDRDVSYYKSPNRTELQARVNKCPPNTDLFISIHCNAFSNSSSHGMETYYYSGSPQSRRLAVLLNEELAKYGGRFNRGVRTANYYVLKHNPYPSSLVELAFLTNYEEENLLANDDYQDALAKAIASAVNRYFNEM